MKEHFLDIALTAAFQVIGPNLVLLCTMGLVILYWEGNLDSPGPIWRDVAFGAMSLVGMMGALAYRAFMLRMRKLEEAQKLDMRKIEEAQRQDREMRERQHRVNQKALVQIIEALRKGDTSNLSITDLM